MKKIIFTKLIIFASLLSFATSHVINAGNYYYTPSTLTINVNDTVQWVNDGGWHDVNFDINSQTGNSFGNPEAFQSSATGSGIIYTHVFTIPGTYNYDCSIGAGSHASAGMVGIIEVVGSNTVNDIVSNSNDHTTLETAINACGLDGTLSGPGPFTLFAPTDAAFNALPAGTVAALLNDIPTLTDILKHHVLGDSVMSTMLSNGMMATTLLGTDVTVTITNGNVYIDNAMVTVADIIADNGVVHVIDAVLLPPTPATNSVYDIVSNSNDHTTLETAINACGLDGTLSGPGPFTLFAPTDAAFNALPAGTVAALLNDIPALTDILMHHVLGDSVMSTMLSNGMMATTLLGTDVTVSITNGNVYIDNAMVTVADIIADNGVVHVIDAVLLPPTPATNSVYDIVSNSNDHTTLETAINACGLDGTLSGPGPFTLFAPTDAAFNALPAGTVAALLNDIPALTDILKHHVLGDSVMSTMLSNGMMATTLLGTDVTVSITNGNVYIDNAMVTVADIIADNGVVHVIDAVLLPPTPATNSVYDIVSNSNDHTILKTALDTCFFTSYLSGPGPFTLFAPTDAAFNALPAGTLPALLNDLSELANILKHHVIGDSLMSTMLSNGMMATTLLGTDVTVSIVNGNVYIDNAMVTVADIIADNGVVHVIDAVLLPPVSNTIYDVVLNSQDHTTLLTAIDTCGLKGTLSGPGPFTLFAPTDAAFNALPAGTVAALLNDIPTLTDILMHHVLGDSVMSTMLSNGMMATTLLGTDVTVSITNGNVYIDNAMVTVADIIADNGVVHVIDAVLLPSTGTNIIENEINDEIVKTINLLGEVVNKEESHGQVLIDIYKSGKTFKFINLQ